MAFVSIGRDCVLLDVLGWSKSDVEAALNDNGGVMSSSSESSYEEF